MLDSKFKQCIFPVYSLLIGQEQTEVSICGTAFIVKNDGIFMSASHVFSKRHTGTKYYFIGNRDLGWEAAPIELKVLHDNSKKDFLIGKVDKQFANKLAISDRLIGDSNVIILNGFPEFEIREHSKGGMDITPLIFNSQVSEVYANNARFVDEEHFPSNVAFTAIIAKHESLKGMSGGPALDEEGHVHGVICGNADINQQSMAAILRQDEFIQILNSFL